jgi:hypothetical protein
MIRELGIRDYEVLTAAKKAIIYTPRVPLINKHKELVPEVKKIFESWFDTYSVDGYMTKDTCVEFIKQSTKDGTVTTQDQRVSKLF